MVRPQDGNAESFYAEARRTNKIYNWVKIDILSNILKAMISSIRIVIGLNTESKEPLQKHV